MTFGTTKRIAAMAILFSAATLTGCLAEEESETGSDNGGQQPQNSPPTISGNPQTAVMMGSSYSFTPSASDSDGDTLTFSVSNQPEWATFNASNGQLSGQPSLADVGVFGQINISVSDGSSSASIPDFSITVSQTELASMTVTWTAPMQNTDGTALTDLAGYRIYYGTAQGYFPNRIVIDTVGLNSYIVENIVADTYYVVATSVNAQGIESAFSNVSVQVAN